MATRAMIDEFLSHKKLALMRSSRTAPVRGVRMDLELLSKGYTVSVVYLDATDPASKLGSLKTPVEGVIIAVPSSQAQRAVQEAIAAKVPRMWLQNGCESATALALCEKSGIPTISGECVLMFTEPVKSFHGFHRWVMKMLGKLPK